MRVLLWAVVVFLLVKMFQRVGARSSSPTPPSRPALPEAMVRCAHCGLHLPVSESVAGPAGTPFCCAEHRQRHLSRA
ncbi:MAG: PP0621 family protein [Burkholderiaceae bacterium]